MRRSIVLFELNEVPWEILDDYVAARPTSALARVLARSHCYTSMTADRGHLSPWTTWPTLHRGVNDERHMSRESGRNVDTGIAKKDAFEVVRHSRRLGIRPATYAALGRQLLAERRRPAMSNRRRTYQSVLLSDIFARQLRRTRPRFSTFFTNHVASAMHRYWAAHRPDDYEQLGLGQDWVETFHDEVMWATGQAADMVERAARHVEANPGAQLWIASSMGQRAAASSRSTSASRTCTTGRTR